MICLTFDTDWMTEASMARFLAEFPIPGSGTFFCHDAFACLQATTHELCPHPFVSDLSDWQAALMALNARVGGAGAGVRAHSCVFSHLMGVQLHELGFRYVSQATALFQSGLAPFRHPWGIWELPIYYMDNMDSCMAANWPELGHRPFASEWIARSLREPGLYVFDFHPLHIALNTPSQQAYQQVKSRILEEHVSPFDLAFAGRGARTYFVELCEAMRAAGEPSLTCRQALASWERRATPVAGLT